MKVQIVLLNSAECELAREEFESLPADADEIDDKATRIIEGWVLSVGDTIQIREVEA